MNIFTQKAKLLKEIKSQKEKIQELKSENKSLKDDVSDLKDSNTEMNKEIKRYKRKYINTHIECDCCYTTLQEDFIYCPKCGKKVENTFKVTAKAKESVFKTEVFDGELIITQYIGFDDPVVVIPSTINGMRVNEIGSKAFYGCKSLTEVVFEEGCQFIDGEAFKYCEKLKKIHFPKSLLVIGERAFSSTGLVDVVIPNNVKEIGWGAFYGCSDLKRIILSDGLTEISSRMLGASGITEIDIPKNVTTICKSAFEDSKLTKVNFSKSVLKIENDAFWRTQITAVTIPPNIKEIVRNNFVNYMLGKSKTIYCVAGSEAQRYARENHFICKEIV